VQTFLHGRSITNIAVYAALFLLWYLTTSRLQGVDRLRFPDPADVVAAARQITFRGYAGGTLAEHAQATILRVALGFFTAASAGVIVGIAMGLQKRFELFINPVIQIFRPIPPLAWIPLAILWFGIDNTSKVFVAWLAVFTPAVINTFAGVRSVDQTLVQAAQVHGARPFNIIMSVVVPSALPMIFTGLRLSLQVSWMAIVASELVGSYTGLGHVMIVATHDLASSMIVVGMFCVAILGLISTKLLAAVEQRMVRWR
jgi:NitT/TauT family transport system permease protein/taurine transport system permease protein